MKQLTNFLGDPNIGLYAAASDKLALLPKFLEGKTFFDTPTYCVSIGGTEFIGIFTAFNCHGIVVPPIARESEVEELKKLFENNLLILKSKYTSIGNLLLVNDKGCIASKLFTRKELAQISDTLGVECVQSSIAGSSVVGSAGFATNKGCLLHRDATEAEIKLVEEVLKVPVEIGTVNFGSPWVSSGLVANSKHAWIGEATTGPELDIIIRTLQL